MKKDSLLFPLFKKSAKDENKAYKWKFRIYPSFLYCKLDRWLNRMSLSGWHIVDSKICFFLFEQGKPEDKKHFTYDPDPPRNDAGAFSIHMRHPFLEEAYGVKKKRSKLHQNRSKTHCIIELDSKKIDLYGDVGYRELVNDRNRLYTMRTIKNTAILILFVFAVILLHVFI